MRRFRKLWSDLRSSFWFVPTLMVAASIGIAIGLVEADSAATDKWLSLWPRLFGATPEGARQLLSTIASSMMTVMGVTFSMTLVALTLASSQYTSRILRNFIRSRITQSTFGIFAGTFAYCLIVLRTIRSSDEGKFVPGLALFFAFVLAIGSVAVVLYFIHHIASSIQASSIIASVAEETFDAIDRLFPAELGDGSEDEANMPQDRRWHPLLATQHGYIQDIDAAALLRLACARHAIVRMERGIGEFVVEGTTLASLSSNDPPDDETTTALNDAYSIDSHRTVDQDPAFGIRQIVDMALKALSPGVNDTSTAVMCVDYLTAILARLADRSFPTRHRYEHDELRVISTVTTFDSLLGSAFDQIRRNAAGNFAILSRLLGAVDTLASLTDRLHRRRALREQVQQISELTERSIEAARDRALLTEKVKRVRKTLVTDAVGDESDSSASV